MPGRAALLHHDEVNNEAHSLRDEMHGGVMAHEESHIRDGRQGADGHGKLEAAPTKDVCEMLTMSGDAKHNTYVNFGKGKTL